MVNHVIDLNFDGFQQMVNAIGCVYADVDRRYYNNTALTDYSSIDIQPGYQKLCGADALAFVRFRHTDSDIVRNARQQDFIRWAKDAYSVAQLLANRDTLLRIFGRNVQTDSGLHSVDQADQSVRPRGRLRRAPLKSIPFPYMFGPCGGGAQTPCYVFASSSGAEVARLPAFMTPTVAAPASGSGSTSASSSASHAAGSAHGHAAAAPTAGLIADPGDGHSQSALLGRIADAGLLPEGRSWRARSTASRSPPTATPIPTPTASTRAPTRAPTGSPAMERAPTRHIG